MPQVDQGVAGAAEQQLVVTGVEAGLPHPVRVAAQLLQRRRPAARPAAPPQTVVSCSLTNAWSMQCTLAQSMAPAHSAHKATMHAATCELLRAQIAAVWLPSKDADSCHG